MKKFKLTRDELNQVWGQWEYIIEADNEEEALKNFKMNNCIKIIQGEVYDYVGLIEVRNTTISEYKGD